MSTPNATIDTEARERYERMQQERIEEENHYARLARVFGGADGFEVLQWLLSITGYWETNLYDERVIARYELGRLIVNQVSLADLDIIHRVLNLRREEKLRQLDEEKRQIEQKMKE